MTHVFRKTKSRRQHAFFCALSNSCCEEATFSSLYWSNPLSKTALGESYILRIGFPKPYLVGFQQGTFNQDSKCDVFTHYATLCNFLEKTTYSMLSFSSQFFKVHTSQCNKFALFCFAKKVMDWKFYSLLPPKRNSLFIRYFFKGYQSGKWSEKSLYRH